MKRNGTTTAFYFETLVMIAVFLAIILVLTQVFALARIQSASAKQLTDAVVLAGNAAEAISYCDDAESLLQLLNEQDNAAALPNGPGVIARYNETLQPDAEGAFCVKVTWQPETAETGSLIRSEIRVLFGEAEREVYRLETAAWKETGS